jgi:thioredoxin-related protein
MITKRDSYLAQQPTISGLLHFFRNITKVLFVILFASFAYAADMDIDKIIKEARDKKKHIMFFHHIPGCPYCEAMIEENFKDDTLLKEINENFIYIDIYTSTEGTIKYRDFRGSYKDFSAHVGAFAYPATLFMNDEGDIIHRAIGYRNIDEHFAEIMYVATGSYKTMDLEAYKQKLEFEKE